VKRTILAIVAIAATSGLIASTAVAADRASVRVQYADLDLTRDPGVDSLYARLRHAANAVCERPGTRDLTSLTLEASCRSRALDEAVARVHNARLTARHTGTGHAVQLADSRLP
jgi:UrcA family protein